MTCARLLDKADRLTVFLCINPRQFTQKFKTWDLHKYERRSGEYKPRPSSSIYRDGHFGLRKHRSLASVTFKPDQDTALEFQESEEIDYYDGDSHANVGWRRQDSAILNPISGMVGATLSSATTIDDDNNEISENNVTSPPTEKSLAAVANIVPTDHAGACSVRPYWNSLYRQDIPWLELDRETLRHLDNTKKALDPRQEVKMRLKKQSLVAMAIRQLWYAGVLNDFESYQSRGLDMPAPQYYSLCSLRDHSLPTQRLSSQNMLCSPSAMSEVTCFGVLRMLCQGSYLAGAER
jgi:hypothetical protein